MVYASGGTIVSLDAFQVVPILSTGTYDDANTAISYIGSWQPLVATGAYQDTWSYSTTMGDSVKFAFNGQQIKLTYVTGPTLGTLDVYVDGVKVGSLNENSANWAWHGTWTSDPLPAGDHILRLVYASGGSMVSLDAFGVIIPQVVSTGIYDDTDTAIGYFGAWQILVDPNAYLDTWSYSTNIGDSGKVAFNGRQIKLTYVTGPILGTMDVYVDEVKVDSIDQNSTDWVLHKTWVSDLLSEGDHILRMVYASGGSLVSLDAFSVVPILSTGTYDDADTAITYVGAWQILVDPNTYLGAWRYSPTTGDSGQFVFSGRQISLNYLPGPTLGTMDVYVDGVLVTSINQYSANWAYEGSWTSDLLSEGVHKVRIVHASNADMVSLDFITVIP